MHFYQHHLLSSLERLGSFITDLLRYNFSVQNIYLCIFFQLAQIPLFFFSSTFLTLILFTAITVNQICPCKPAMNHTFHKRQTRGNTVNKFANPEMQYYPSGEKNDNNQTNQISSRSNLYRRDSVNRGYWDVLSFQKLNLTKKTRIYKQPILCSNLGRDRIG